MVFYFESLNANILYIYIYIYSFLPSYCGGIDGAKFTSVNIEDMQMGAGSPLAITFKYTSDHSKWGISLTKDEPYVCVGDINRMQSQRARGGDILHSTDTFE